jgi:hypothetical protein
VRFRRQINLPDRREARAETTVAFGGEGTPEDLAQPVRTILRWDWLDQSFSVEARRVLPILLLELFFAEREGRNLSKKQACDIMGVDSAKTGPNYIVQAEKKGWLVIDQNLEKDRRKHFLRPTPKLMDFLATELKALYHEIDRQRGRSSMGSSAQHLG